MGEDSGCLDGFPRIGLATDHFQIQRFPHARDNNWLLVREELVKFARNAPGDVQRRLNGEDLAIS